MSDHGAIQKSGISHLDARKALKYKLDLIHQTAQVLNLDQFYMPRQKTDAAYIAAAQSFAQLVLPHKKGFIKQGLPSDFVEALNAAVADLQQRTRSECEQRRTLQLHRRLQEAPKEALIDLKRFDALVNTLSGNDGNHGCLEDRAPCARLDGKTTPAQQDVVSSASSAAFRT